MMILAEIGEDSLIERLVKWVPCGVSEAGPGDDCAVIDEGCSRLRLLKTDSLVEGIHFLSNANAEQVGWKAIARVVSDFAAMGGVGELFLVSIALPNTMELIWIEDFYKGMGRCLRAHAGLLVGGETCRVPDGSAAVISISALGSVAREDLVLRSGAKPGDEIWVTGRLGGSLKGKHLNFSPRVAEAQWIARNLQPTAMMDISDGIAKDLPRLAKASGCGFQIHLHSIPCTEGCDINAALVDGEDFELLFTKPPDGNIGLWSQCFKDLELTRIGVMTDENTEQNLEGGWDHFSGSR